MNVKRFNKVLRLTKCVPFSLLFKNYLMSSFKEALAENPSSATNVVLSELLRSTSAPRSMFLLEMLQELPDVTAEQCPELIDFFRFVPADKISLKILLTRIILSRCVSTARLPEIESSDLPQVSDHAFVPSIQPGSHPELSMAWIDDEVHEVMASYLGKNHKGDYSLMQEPKRWVAELKSSCEKGDIEAKYILSLTYSDGYGTAQDCETGMRLHQEAAEAGCKEAQCALGNNVLRRLSCPERPKDGRKVVTGGRAKWK